MTSDAEHKVIALVRDTLALEQAESISVSQLLFHELGFTSMDLLDLLFRIEEELGVAIPEGTLHQLARGDLAEHEFSREGHLTSEGRRRLMELLFDSPPEIFHDRIHVQTLHRYCTVGAFVRIVEHKLRP